LEGEWDQFTSGKLLRASCRAIDALPKRQFIVRSKIPGTYDYSTAQQTQNIAAQGNQNVNFENKKEKTPLGWGLVDLNKSALSFVHEKSYCPELRRGNSLSKESN
jgi:hypothetical protein